MVVERQKVTPKKKKQTTMKIIMMTIRPPRLHSGLLLSFDGAKLVNEAAGRGGNSGRLVDVH